MAQIFFQPGRLTGWGEYGHKTVWELTKDSMSYIEEPEMPSVMHFLDCELRKPFKIAPDRGFGEPVEVHRTL